MGRVPDISDVVQQYFGTLHSRNWNCSRNFFPKDHFQKKSRYLWLRSENKVFSILRTNNMQLLLSFGMVSAFLILSFFRLKLTSHFMPSHHFQKRIYEYKVDRIALYIGPTFQGSILCLLCTRACCVHVYYVYMYIFRRCTNISRLYVYCVYVYFVRI